MMMAEYQHEAKNLPPGWDCKYDVNTGKCYYFNYLTKAMSLEDPRIRMRQLQLQQPQDPSITNMAEQIPLQPMHGSPYHVYPTNNHQAVQAFQGPHPNTNTMVHHHHQQPSYQYGASPMLVAKYHQQLEMSPIQRHHQHAASPHMPRIMSQLARQQQQPMAGSNLSPIPMSASLSQQQQETSFITAADTETAVTRINTMFPTANDDHIRLLMKKYHNREAVVISALQVEKHPIATPGPFATPPPPGRHATLLAAAANAFGINASTTTVHSMTPLLGRGHGSRSSSRFVGIVSEALLASSSSRTGSPVPVRPTSSCASVMTMATTVMPLHHHHQSLQQHHASSSHGIAAAGGSPRVAGDSSAYRSSPKPHSSPKMKLRYLKSIFPKADETLLLDTLANADNNVQHASEHLLTLGYDKRDTTAPKVTNRHREEQVMRERHLAENTPPPQPKVRTNEEKQRIKAQLQAQYADIPGRIITMALESVEYSEDRACQILKIVMQDDNKQPPAVASAVASASDETDTGLTSTTEIEVRTDVYGSNSEQSPSSSDSLASEATTTATSTADDSETSNDVQLLRKSKRVRAMTHSKSHSQIGAKPIATMVKSSTTIMPATSTEPDTSVSKAEYQSTVERSKTDGPNAEQCKGPNEELLLADYISWNGANPDMRVGHKSLARGSNAALRSASSGRHIGSTATGVTPVTGANAELCKGAQVGLAKGSMYAKLGRQMTNVKCN